MLNLNDQPYVRSIRVFVSSTFRDMFAEREELVKFIFPELRKRCRKRQVEFTDVDLRWGITDEQKAEGKVLPICLAEIEHCRPYFLGILGEHYGWLPDEIDPSLADEHEWLKEHREKSVTELEIIKGVLKDPDMKRLAYFYFRDPQKSEEVEKELRRQPGYVPEPETSRKKLKSLKQHIEESGYPIHKDYPDAKSFGQMVFEDLWAAIDQRFPEEEVPSPLKRERFEHEIFAEVRRKVYIGREKYFERLDKHIKNEDPPLIILGDAGSGKSALIANWVKRHRESHSDNFMVVHFIGSTPYSADYVSILHRIMEEIKAWTEEDQPDIPSFSVEGRENEIPVDPLKLIEQFTISLAKAAAKGKMILILDGLNQLEDSVNAPDLGWLPTYFPPNVRVILSSLPSRSLEALKKRNWSTMQVKKFSVKERQKFIIEYLAQYTKELNSSQAKRIATADQTSNPLYLRVLLEELRIYGDHDTLQQRIKYFLKEKTTDKLYERILERWEEDYEQERRGLVGASLSLIWASRSGLAETEILELLGSKEKPLQKTYWSPFYLAVEESLVSRGGLFNFFHDFLKNAVEKKYLKSIEKKSKAYLRLAKYFENDRLSERGISELPYYLMKSEQWVRLKDSIVDIDNFLTLNTPDKKYELIGYWNAIRKRYDPVKEYKNAIKVFEENCKNEEEIGLVIYSIADYLSFTAGYLNTENLFKRVLEIREKVLGQNHYATLSSLNNLALLYYKQGNYDKAESLFKRKIQLSEKVSERSYNQIGSFINLSQLYKTQGNDYKAQGDADKSKNEFNEAQDNYDKAQNYYDNAEQYINKAIEISEKTQTQNHYYTLALLEIRASLYQAQGKFFKAEILLTKVLELTEKLFGTNHPETAHSIHNLASLFSRLGNYIYAEKLFMKVLEIQIKTLGFHPNTGKTLGNLDYVEKMQLRERELGLEVNAAMASLNNLAVYYLDKGDINKVEPILKKALYLAKSLSPNHLDKAKTLSNLALLYQVNSKYDKAEQLLNRAAIIYEKVLGPNHSLSQKIRTDLDFLKQFVKK